MQTSTDLYKVWGAADMACQWQAYWITRMGNLSDYSKEIPIKTSHQHMLPF